MKKSLLAASGLNKWEIGLEGEGTIQVSDGPHGLRIEQENKLGFAASKPAPVYPTAAAAACSFDRDLIYETGTALAYDCIQENIQILLGPGVNHKRTPLCGRNFEYFSEDPVLSGELGAAFVRGLQDQGVGACVKHFAADGREFLRTSYDSIIDERTLHELYLRQFEIIVKKAKPWSIMPAYNRLNGNYCCENKKLLAEGRSWGFDGAYISDWGAVSDPAASFRSGLNVQMPGPDQGASKRIEEQVKAGTIAKERVDENTEVIRNLIRRCSDPAKIEYDSGRQLRQSQKAAERSIVLAENNGLLPLQKEMKIALIGENAKHPYDQGEGSSRVNPLVSSCLAEAFRERKISFLYCDGSDIQEAVKYALACDAAVIVASPEEKDGETYDRKHMQFSAHDNELIERVLASQPDTVVCVQSGAPVILPWADRAAAVILTYLSGSLSSEALADILFGDINPCGKVSETWPLNEKDYPHGYESGHEFVIPYRETLYSGYRYYNTFDVEVRYCFGHGLSYTTFAYDDLKIEEKDGKTEVSFTLRNTGELAGRESVQLYVGMKDSRIVRTCPELKEFASIPLDAGEEKRVEFVLDQDAFAYYDAARESRQVEKGTYEILIGASSRDIRLKGEISLNGIEDPYSPFAEEDFHGALIRDNKTFEKVIGHSLPEAPEVPPFTPDSTIEDLRTKRIGRASLKVIDYIFEHTDMVTGIRKDAVFTTPLRHELMAWDRLTWDSVDAITEVLNGHPVKGVKKLIRSIF